MMMKTIQILSLGLLFLLTACNKDDNQTINDGERFELSFGETVDLWERGMMLEFTAIEENRCPGGPVLCITNGEAIASMKLTTEEGGTPLDFKLTAQGLCDNDDGSCGQSDTLGGVIVQLINIDPQLNGVAEIDDSEYSLQLKVSKE